MAEKVAVVTGSNKGIGLEIVRRLCKAIDGIVYLTARDLMRGEAAVAQLKEEGLNPAFYQLDITNEKSVNDLAKYIKEKHGGLDILVNNAAIRFPLDATEPLAEQAEVTMRTNYYAVKTVAKALYPLLRPGARVVNISSSAGHLLKIPNENLRKRFADSKITDEELDALVEEYIQDCKNGTNLDQWPTGYSVSKVAVSTLTRLQHRQFLEDSRKDLVINDVHPGLIDTDMAADIEEIHGFEKLTVQEGAEAPVYCALLPPNCESPKGNYVWRDKSIVDWINGPTPTYI